MRAIADSRPRALEAAAAVGAVAFFALCTAAGAQAKLRLPFSPVPVTAQTLFVLLSGALLGRGLGPLSQAAYIAVAVSWPGAVAGPIHFTAGYLVGFVVAAYVIGAIAGDSCSFPRIAGAMALGSAAIYLLGAAWLAGVSGSLQGALVQGVLPFLPGDAVKLLLAAAVVVGGRRLRRRPRGTPPHSDRSY